MASHVVLAVKEMGVGVVWGSVLVEVIWKLIILQPCGRDVPGLIWFQILSYRWSDVLSWEAIALPRISALINTVLTSLLPRVFPSCGRDVPGFGFEF